MAIRFSTIRLCVALIAGMTCIAGCNFGYYWQAAAGHMELMRQTRPVDEIIADLREPVELRESLVAAADAVVFAHERLLLPDNGSYELFADIGRPYAVWNVVAAPPLSLEAHTWCFPVAGCVGYRGYFARDSADAFATALRAAGDDVFVGGVAAYSTLGRFADPLLNTMMDLPAYRLAGVIFHELAHQRLYVPGDTQFNESFASFVEAEGIRRWLKDRGEESALCRSRLESSRHREVLDMLGVIRTALQSVYAQDLPDAVKLRAKSTLLATINPAYDRLKGSWDGPPDFDHWFSASFNNARFAILAAYDDDVRAFAALLEQSGGDLEAFYRRVAELAAESVPERRIRLDALRDAFQGDVAAPDEPAQPCQFRVSESAAAGLADRGANRGSAGSDLRPARSVP